MDEEKKQSSKKELASKLKTAEAAAREKALKNAKLCKGLAFMPSLSPCDEVWTEQPGKGNWQGNGFNFQPFVTFVSLALLITLIVLTLIFPQQLSISF